MALSKEFYLDEIRSKYPNSYNESLQDLPVKDLEDMLDFLDQALGKADGGSIGIEVLFGPKRDEYQTGGRIGFNMGGAQFTSGDNISPGTDKRGKVRNDNPFTGGGGGDDGPKGPPAIINPPPTKDKSTELLTFDEYTGKPMTYADVATANKFLNLVKTKGSYTMGEDPEADALYDAYRTATGRDTFMQDATVDSVTNMRTTDIDGDTKSFFDQTSTITDNPTGRMSKSLMVETPTSFTQRFITPTGIMENDVPQKFGAPQSLAVDPPKNIIGSELKDGGRVGFFMGGPALEGQALQIYNSMNSYGFSDQEIADALSARGLYTPAGSGTTTQPEQVTGIIGAQINQDRDDGPKGDFGDFGNLLKDTEKTFTKNVYTQTGPVTFDFVPTEVKGYRNVNTGLYQTKEGKNINHLGIEVPTIAGMLLDKNFGKGPQVGDIEGTFTKGIPTNFFKNPLGIFKKQQATLADIQAMNKKAVDDLRAKQAAEKAAKEAAIAAEMAKYNITPGSDFGGGTPGGGGGNVKTTGGDVYGGSAYGYNEAEEKTDYYRDGGRVGLFMGGPPLTGQPLAIYNSMNAYGFSDQEIANAIIEAGYKLPKKETSTTTTTTPITNTAPNIINQGGGDGPNIDPPGFDKGFSSLNFGLGPNKDVVDYEAEAYGIGPTFKGTFAKALTALKNIPTPFNIARMGIEKAIDFANAKKERERIAAAKAAAELKAKQAIAEAEKKAQEQAILDAAYQTQTITQQQAGGGEGGQFDGAASKADYDADPTGYSGSFNRGGLATMFTRRR